MSDGVINEEFVHAVRRAIVSLYQMGALPSQVTVSDAHIRDIVREEIAAARITVTGMDADALGDVIKRAIANLDTRGLAAKRTA